MENIENLLQVYEQLRSYTNPDEVEMLRKSLEGSIHVEKRRKGSDRDLCKNGGSKEPRYQNVRKSPMLPVADESAEMDNLIKAMLPVADESAEMDNLIKEVDNLIKEVKEFPEIGKFGNDFTIEVHEELQVEFPTSNLVGEEFERYMNDISDLLTKNKASTIGVWGMGGVGKTTLIRHLYNMMLAQPHIYNSIYWITVSKDCSIQKLQTDIAERIGESISNKFDESQRAGILAKALKRKENFVMILDDMWSSFDLNEVGLGIPKEIGYRLIVTSRLKDVCLKMYCDNIIKVDPLSEKDAWTLFFRSIGREIPDHLTKISIDVLKECAGLPLGIITLAKSLLGCNDICEWRYVLDELRNSSGKVDDMVEKVFNVLRLSYERLKDSEIKECLLYCATYPEDYQIKINELISLFIDAGLLGKNVGMAKLFDKGLAVLKKLERAALLSIKREYVCLHDLIRDMTLQIAGSRFMIKARMGLKNIPNEESWTDQLEVVSLMHNEMEGISDLQQKCNRLTTLLLHRNYSLSIICDGFFRRLDGLKLLELSDIAIRTLPESISFLKNLTALILRGCMELENVPSLAKLTSLEKLDLSVTSISQLPKGIGSLIKLKYFSLCNTRIRRIGVGVISKLTNLQYLAIDSRIEVKELNSLNNLEHLSIQFEDFASFSTFIEQMNIKGRLNSYTFLLGNERVGFGTYVSNQLSEKHIYVRNIKSWESKVSDVNQYGRLLNILFGNHNKSFGYSFEIERKVKFFFENELQKLFQDIQRIDIKNDWELMSLGDFVIDPMCNLQRQSKIGGPKTFFNLKSLKLSFCENLKKLFPLKLLSNLQNIEVIRVEFCFRMEELIEGAADETNLREIGYPQIFSLPKLRSICLFYLSNLERLCSDDTVIGTPSLEWIIIEGCGKLKRVGIDVDNQHQPKVWLRGEKAWVESLEWDPPESKSRFSFCKRMNKIDNE